MDDLNKQLSELQELKDLGNNITEEQLNKGINKLNERKKKFM